MRVLIVGSSLGMGGAERAAANAARILAGRHDVSVFTFHRRVDYDAGAKVASLDIPYDIDTPLHRKVGKFVAKVRGLRAAISSHRPDVVLAFGDSASLICLANKLTMPRLLVVTNTQAPPTRVYKGAAGRFYLGLIRAFFPRADRSVALSTGVRDEIVARFGVRRERAVVIYNTVDLDSIARAVDNTSGDTGGDTGDAAGGRDALVDEMERGPCLLNIGRLMPQKNQLLLLRAFRVVRDRVAAKLVIAGTGPLEAELKAEAGRLRLDGDVIFAGWQPNPFRLMKRARAFVLSSDYEGFGNVLVEAMAADCPVISTDCDFGPSELLRAGPSDCGLLVPVGDQAALAAAMLRVLEDEPFGRALAQRGLVRARDFSFEAVGRSYDALMDELSSQVSSGRHPPVPCAA